MTLLANAGIYLVLDVNSPLEDENLNRYEPWTSYNEIYLEHIFKVVEQFSYYPNTLAFFAGNEVINDRRSAKASSTYVKAVVRDLKTYIKAHSPRNIPVGYSAADDLHYRTSLAKYLECEEDPLSSVDFYGVNSYQWCGEQTFQSSGFSTLVQDYQDYTKPIFFSEYGCNEVRPRIFQEVSSLYSKDMIGVFSGGLVYEFSQEPNNYGLVEHLPNGDVKLLPDFYALKESYAQTPDPSGYELSSVFKTLRKKERTPQCQESYENLEIDQGLPVTLANFFIEKGVSAKRGKFVPLTENDMATTYTIIDVDDALVEKTSVVKTIDIYAKEANFKAGAFENGIYYNLDDQIDKESEEGMEISEDAALDYNQDGEEEFEVLS